MPPRSPNDPEPVPIPDHRRARAWTALGFLTGCTLVWGSIGALNHSFLGFHAWPTAEVPKVERLVLVAPEPPRSVRGTSHGRVSVAPGGGTPTTLFPAGGPALAGTPSVTTRGPSDGARPGGATPSVGTPGGVLAPGSAPDASAEPRDRSRGVGPTTATGGGERGTDQIGAGGQPIAQVTPPSGAPQSGSPATPTGQDPQRVDAGRTDAPEGDGSTETESPPAPADQPAPDVPAPAEPAPAEPAPAEPADPPVTDPGTGGVEAPEEPPAAQAPVAEAPAPEAAATPAP